MLWPQIMFFACVNSFQNWAIVIQPIVNKSTTVIINWLRSIYLSLSFINDIAVHDHRLHITTPRSALKRRRDELGELLKQSLKSITCVSHGHTVLKYNPSLAPSGERAEEVPPWTKWTCTQARVSLWFPWATHWSTAPSPSCWRCCRCSPWGWSSGAEATGQNASAPGSCCARCTGFLSRPQKGL